MYSILLRLCAAFLEYMDNYQGLNYCGYNEKTRFKNKTHCKEFTYIWSFCCRSWSAAGCHHYPKMVWKGNHFGFSLLPVYHPLFIHNYTASLEPVLSGLFILSYTAVARKEISCLCLTFIYIKRKTKQWSKLALICVFFLLKSNNYCNNQ